LYATIRKQNEFVHGAIMSSKVHSYHPYAHALLTASTMVAFFGKSKKAGALQTEQRLEDDAVNKQSIKITRSDPESDLLKDIGPVVTPKL
jgi:hypothetical protein